MYMNSEKKNKVKCASNIFNIIFTTVLKLVLILLFVEVPGFEPGMTEPKSVVLPLHHTSI